MKVKCDICKVVLPNFNAAARHAAEHEPVRVKPSRADPLFRVGWKKDGTIRQPKGER